MRASQSLSKTDLSKNVKTEKNGENDRILKNFSPAAPNGTAAPQGHNPTKFRGNFKNYPKLFFTLL